MDANEARTVLDLKAHQADILQMKLGSGDGSSIQLAMVSLPSSPVW